MRPRGTGRNQVDSDQPTQKKILHYLGMNSVRKVVKGVNRSETRPGANGGPCVLLDRCTVNVEEVVIWLALNRPWSSAWGSWLVKGQSSTARGSFA